MAILFTVALILLLAALSYLWWIALSAFKRQWRKLAILITIPCVILTFLAIGISIESKIEYVRYLEELFDTPVKFSNSIYSYDSERSFNGDGFSICVYDIPDSIRKRFASADKRLLSEFPHRPSYRSHWKTLTWKQAPFNPALDKFLGFALSSYDADRTKGLSAQFSAIRTALSRSNTFYAIFYNDPGKYIGDIDLFVVDLDDGKLYFINHNT